jgi:hypothetical protein
LAPEKASVEARYHPYDRNRVFIYYGGALLGTAVPYWDRDRSEIEHSLAERERLQREIGAAALKLYRSDTALGMVTAEGPRAVEAAQEVQQDFVRKLTRLDKRGTASTPRALPEANTQTRWSDENELPSWAR